LNGYVRYIDGYLDPERGIYNNMNNLNIEIGECIDIKFMDMRIAQIDSTITFK